MAVDKIEDTPVMSVAACVLYNICLMDDVDDIEDPMYDSSNDYDHDDHDDDNDNDGDALLRANCKQSNPSNTIQS